MKADWLRPMIFGALLAMPPLTGAQASEAPTAKLPPSSTFAQSTTSSVVVAPDNGTAYRLDVRLPASYGTTNKRYPVVYVLDGNLMFGTAVEYVGVSEFTQELPEVIVVGIGYRDPSLASVIGQRRRDFTLAADEAGYAKMRESAPNLPPSLGSGGASLFSKHLRELIKPFILSHYRADTGKQILFGDSLAGGFGAYHLLTHPETFTGYVLGSPAIVQADGLIFKLEDRYAKTHRDLPAQVFMSVGALETPSMRSGMQDLAAKLRTRAFPSLRLTTHTFEGETHTMALSSNFIHGLRTLLCDERAEGRC